VESFVRIMNDRAAKLGLTNTHFVTPNGLHDAEHYTTAYELALIGAEALKNETFRQIVSTQYYTAETGDRVRTMKNKNALLALSKDDSVSIMVNEEDHLRVQVLASGLDLERALDIANKMDDVLDESLDYAFDDQLGFLTACPSNLGTGLRASVMLHIPALEKAGALNKMSGTISKLGLTLRGTYGEGSKALGSIYQLSNQITLGISEEQAVKNLHEITLQIIEKEREARKALVKSEKFVDQIYRCYGILKYAKLISSEEFFDLMSYVRIGISEKVLTSDIAEHVTMQKLNYLLSQVGSATISQNAKEDLPPEKRDSIRAKIIQEIL